MCSLITVYTLRPKTSNRSQSSFPKFFPSHCVSTSFGRMKRIDCSERVLQDRHETQIHPDTDTDTVTVTVTKHTVNIKPNHSHSWASLVLPLVFLTSRHTFCIFSNQVVYVEHAHHQHHYEDHGDDWSEPGSYWKRSLQTDPSVEDTDSSTDSYQVRQPQQQSQIQDPHYLAYRNQYGQWQQINPQIQATPPEL